MSRIAVTGASGFLGRHLLESLRSAGHTITVLSRVPVLDPWTRKNADEICSDLTPVAGADWIRSLTNIEVVCHLAARAHVLRETASNPVSEFHAANSELTRKLATAAAQAGVHRFVFVSTIGVHGNSCEPNEIWSEQSPLRPQTPYAQSKLLAEDALREISVTHSLQHVILRPPLIHGAHAKGNFERLCSLIARRFPLPLASIKNRRSFIGARNLADLILQCIEAPLVKNRSFTVADEEVLSTPSLIQALGLAMNKPARLVPCPVSFLHDIARLTGRQRQIEQLVDSLEVNSDTIRAALQWTQPYSAEQSLSEMALNRMLNLSPRAGTTS